MDIERKCVQCWYAAEDASPQNQLPVIGQPKRYMCLFGPIAATAIPTPQGQILAIASYPSVNEQTISCGRWTPIPSKEVQALVRKGTNDGNA
jgi:hypothetical protein